MDQRPVSVVGSVFARVASRRSLIARLRSAGAGGVLALLGLKSAGAAPGPGVSPRSTLAQEETENPTSALFIPGDTWTLELSARGAGSDIRNWERQQVGSIGGPLYINNVRAGAADTILNVNEGNVGIGVDPPAAKLHVAGDLRVDGSLIGPLSFASPHPGDDDLEIVYASPVGGESGSYARGAGELRDGEAIVELPGHFALLTEPDGLTVQLTARGQPLRLFVAELTPERLVVRDAEAQAGSFDFLVQGVRKGAGDFSVVRSRSRRV